MEEDNLVLTIFTLAKKAKEVVIQESKANPPQRIRRPFMRPDYVRFEYEGGRISYQSKGEVEDFEESWDYIWIIRVAEAKVKALEEYDAALKAVMKIKSVGAAQAEFWFRSFMMRLGEQALDNASEDELLGSALSFAYEIENSPTLHTSIFWLTGIWIQDDKVELGGGISFRKPTREDIDSPRGLFFREQVLNHELPSVILQYSMKTANQDDLRKQARRIVICLRLFSVGSVSILAQFNLTRKYLSMFSSVESNLYKSRDLYRYPISVAKRERLEQFLSIIAPLIPADLVNDTKENIDYLVIAIQRYEDALMKMEVIESRITFAVMALEALYLGKTERQELKDRLSQRAAKLLGFFDLNALDVYTDIGIAYEIRSSFVHGSPVENQGDLTEFAREILEYVRKSIVITLQVRGNYESKEKFLASLDKSLLDHAISEGIKKSVTERCKLQ